MSSDAVVQVIDEEESESGVLEPLEGAGGPSLVLPWDKEAPAITLASLRGDGDEGDELERAYWQSVLFLEDLIGGSGVFDRRTFEPREQEISQVYQALWAYFHGEERSKRDLLMRLMPVLFRALGEIAREPRTRLARRYEELVLHKVQEQDVRCLMKLSRRPGRTAREKAAQTGKAPAVVRYESLDIPENRLVRRVVEELYRALQARKEADLERGLESDWRVESEASQFLFLCRRILRESEFGELLPSVVVEANNTLLGDPNYNSVLRAFRAFRRRQEVFERSWERAIYQAPQALAWALRGELSLAKSWVSTEAFGKAVLPGSGESEALFEFDAGGAWFFKGGKEPEVLTIEVGGELEGRTLYLRRWRLVGEEPLRVRDEGESWRVTVEVSEEAPKPSRGVGLELYLEREGGDGLAVYATSFDREGICAASLWVLGCLGLESSGRQHSERGVEEGSPYRGACLDLSGPRARVLGRARGGECEVEDGGLLYAKTIPVEGERDRFIAGDGATRAISPDDEGWIGVGVRQVWMGGEGDWALKEAARGGIRGVGSSTELVLLMCDDADEVDIQRMRRLLPTTHSGRWVVWRSVAAALLWREELASKESVEEGDVVVVLDTRGPKVTATMLISRRERCDEVDSEAASAERRWYWERTAPFVVGAEGATAMAFRERLAWELVSEDCPPGLVDRLIDEGHLDRVRAGSRVEVPLFVDGAPALFQRELEPEVLQKVREETKAELLGWLERDFKNAMERVVFKRMKREGGALHILLDSEFIEEGSVGELFPKARIQKLNALGDDSLFGAAVFLERHREGFGTWRDMIPALQLEVGAGRWIDLLDPEVIKEGVRPGQALSYRPPERFSLPKEEEAFDLPMRSETFEGGRSGADYTAHIGDESLPLEQDLSVQLEVVYHYAEDEFRIRILPDKGERRPPFEVLEVQWVRGEGRGSDGGREVRNEPPEFSESLSWEELEDWRVEEFKEQRQELERLLKDKFFNSSKLQGRLRNDVSGVVKDLKKLVKRANEISRKNIFYLVPVGRTLERAPKEVQREIDSLQARLLELAEVDSGRKKKKKKGGAFPRRLLRRAKNNQIDRAVEDLREEALVGLSRLRHLSSEAVLKVLWRDLKQTNELGRTEVQGRFESFGRALGDLRISDRAYYFDTFLMSFGRYVDENIGAERPKPILRDYLWALATALWSNEFVVQILSEEQAKMLVEWSLKLAQRLDEAWFEEGISIEIFKELGLVILALLRLRGGEFGDLVRAGNEFCGELAGLMESIDQKTGLKAHARIDVGEDDEAMGFGELVAANLRGYKISRIQIRED